MWSQDYVFFFKFSHTTWLTVLFCVHWPNRCRLTVPLHNFAFLCAPMCLNFNINYTVKIKSIQQFDSWEICLVFKRNIFSTVELINPWHTTGASSCFPSRDHRGQSSIDRFGILRIRSCPLVCHPKHKPTSFTLTSTHRHECVNSWFIYAYACRLHELSLTTDDLVDVPTTAVAAIWSCLCPNHDNDDDAGVDEVVTTRALNRHQ